MDYNLLIKKAKEKGINEIEIDIRRNRSDSIETFNDGVQEIELSNTKRVTISAIIGNKKVVMSFEVLKEKDFDRIIENILLYSKEINSKEKHFFSANKNSYPVIETRDKNLDIKKIKKELFEINLELRKIEEKIINVEMSYDVFINEIILLNSMGLDVRQITKLYTYAINIVCEFEGKQYTQYKNISVKNKKNLDMLKIAKETVSKCIGQIGGTSIQTNDYEIVLNEEVVADLLRSMISVFSAENINKDKSILKGKLNKKIVSNKITLIEDPSNDKFVQYRYFDDEGEETKYKEIIKDGVLQTYLYDLKNANKDGVESTGNSFSRLCRNLYIKPGEHSLKEMIESIKEGILIENITGLNAGLNSNNGNFSLQIQGKYIKQGKIVKPITLMVVSGNFFDMLKNVIMVGDKVETRGKSFGGTALKIKSLTISGN